jgi:hypothetical protein
MIVHEDNLKKLLEGLACGFSWASTPEKFLYWADTVRKLQNFMTYNTWSANSAPTKPSPMVEVPLAKI